MTIRFTPLRGGAVRVVTAALAVIAMAAVFTPLAPSANAAPGAVPLALDLSRHKVDITTGFTGANLLLFGAMPQAGNVIVVIRGPSYTETIRRKARKIGIRVNSGRDEINGAPSYYQEAAAAQAGTAQGADATARRLREIDIIQGKRVHPFPLGRRGRSS